MNDELDELLREEGRRWVTVQSIPALDDMLSAATSRRRPRPVFAVAAAITVAVVVAVIPLSRSITASKAPGGDAGASAQPSSAAVTADIQTPSDTAPIDVLRKLVERARSTAIADGDPAATGEAVRTTYLHAERTVLDGDTSSNPPGATAVWVIQIHGTFICNTCHGPAGSFAPRGTAIALVLNARSFVGYDFTLTRAPHDLSPLGTVVHLPM